MPSALLFACSNIIFTKGTTTDGSTIITYSADSNTLFGEIYFMPAAVHAPSDVRQVYDWDSGKYLGVIPQAAQTYQRVGNMNEHQLIITETTFGGRRELRDPNGKIDYGSLIHIALERSTNAREAIKVIGELVDTYGYYSGGESFSIGDTNEAWIMEIIGKGGKEKGAVWVAVRIPDGYICSHANQARIRTFDQNDPENCIYSKDVISFAKSQGFYEGADKDFSFADAYNPLDFMGMRACEARVWSAFNQAGCDVEKYLDYAMGHNPENRMPLYMKAPKKYSPKDIADFMRDHYEDTPLDMRADIGAGGDGLPVRWGGLTYEYDGKTYCNERSISTKQSGWWIMCQSRGWLPNEVGSLIWFGVDEAATSCLTPIYVSSKEMPLCIKEGNGNIMEYSPTSAFWLFSRVAHFTYLHYQTIYPDVKKAIDEHENSAIARSASIDKTAVELLKTSKDAAVDYLTDYSIQTAQSMFDKWDNLDKYLLVKYVDGAIKAEDENGFKENGNNRNLPARSKPMEYSDKWKEAVVKDAGDKLIVKEVE